MFKKIILFNIWTIILLFSGCVPLPDELTSDIPALTLNVALSNPSTGTLHCNFYKNNENFSKEPDWFSAVRLDDASGVQKIIINISTDEITDNAVYLYVWLDEDNDGVQDDDEYLEYYGNLAAADLSAGRVSLPITIGSNGNAIADMILDKKVNDLESPIAADSIEINIYYTNFPIDQWLIMPVYKGSGGNIWHSNDFYGTPTKPETTSGITKSICTSIKTESAVYFLVRTATASSGSNPQIGEWFEFYNNKNANQATSFSTIPVGSAMDVILDIKYPSN